ncbi:hypothetical protein N7510_005131 [Penicillium lagena]|uniref:uncharacterized protein n=1 Tax=Penicillium lagena TaxID=94218 RepID=UPI002541ACB2|nr:uncharacterized protein N7510_005131 [Penicillium lagena]KAJ5621147.1 hypothetical protein N7510_005131 [Penicillium lagena]
MEGSEGIDLLIVGAGLHGLAMAKTYLQVHPNGRLLVMDQAKSVGGSWAKERLYPGLKTNNTIGSYEFGDFPMVPERYGVKAHGHIPGEVVHAYFCDVVVHYGIDSYLRLETRVQSATLGADGRWSMRVESIKESQQRADTLVAAKIAIATGLTSEPYIPTFPGQEDFGGLVLHSKQLKEETDNLGSCKSLVVLGGNKSAWDVCYAAAQSGSQVHMVIRPTGGGPSYLWPREFSWGSFKLSLAKLSATRLFVSFDPTPYGKIGCLALLRHFLHQTLVGQKVCQFFWTRLDAHIKKLNGYHTHPELQKLEPWTTPFWMGNSLSIHNYDTNWFDFVREGKISIHIADLAYLSKGRVHLSTGEMLDADALACCTGWKTVPTIQFDTSCAMERARLGIAKGAGTCNSVGTEWEISRLISYLSSVPRRVGNAPAIQEGQIPQLSSSYQLYRMVIPSQPVFLEKKNLAFIGLHSSVHAVLVAQAQALWIMAFFDDKIRHLSPLHINIKAVEYRSFQEGIYERYAAQGSWVSAE